MRNPSSEEAARWLAQAARDLDAAALLRRGGHANLACFHAQQAAEKAVKAFLYGRGAEDVRGHSVSRLLSDAGTFDDRFTALRTTGATLDKFYIPTRYPNGLPGGLPADAYTADEAATAIAKANHVLATVRSALDSPAVDHSS